MSRKFQLVGALGLTLLVPVSSAAAAPLGAPFATKSGTCSGSFTAAPVSSAHENVSVALRLSGTNEVIWRDANSVSANGSPYFYCYESGPATVEWYDQVLPPTTWNGRLASGNDASHTSLTASRATFVADITIRSGAGSFCPPYSTSAPCETLASSATMPVGATTSPAMRVRASDGPALDYTLTLRPLPVAVGSLAWSASTMRPGIATKLGYTLDGDTSVTATVFNATGQPVRSLASGLAASSGDRSLTWDGKDSSGAPVPDGDYRATVSSSDPYGGTSSATAAIRLDGTPPSIAPIAPLTPQSNLVINVSDASGVASASASILDQPTLGSSSSGGNPQATTAVQVNPPYDGWVPGRSYTASVAVRDALGNSASPVYTFRVPTPPGSSVDEDVSRPANLPKLKGYRYCGDRAAGGSWVMRPVTATITDRVFARSMSCASARRNGSRVRISRRGRPVLSGYRCSTLVRRSGMRDMRCTRRGGGPSLRLQWRVS